MPASLARVGVAISIHAAREGGDFCRRERSFCILSFQSTPPVKAATRKTITDVVAFVFQSTPPVKAATLRRSFRRLSSKFQSTPPVKAAT